MKETIFYVFLASSVIFDVRNDLNEWIFNTWSMYSKTCPIPVQKYMWQIIWKDAIIESALGKIKTELKLENFIIFIQLHIHRNWKTRGSDEPVSLTWHK
jgi:hypothetical protein